MSARTPLQSSPDWKNWTQDVVHKANRSGKYYYFSPANRAELQEIVRQAGVEGVQVRVSGQRHSQPPLVIEDCREDPAYKSKTWLIDLSCYADLGPKGDQQILVDAENKTVTVNAGVREDYLSAYLATQDLIMQTVTAGGFFSLGGMTAIDVNGATFQAPIFAETVISFSVMGADGEVTEIDESTPGVDDWKAIQFARVSLGALGIVTSMTVSVLARKSATALVSGWDRVTLDSESAFVAKYHQLITEHDRAESFFNPYNNDFFILWWDLKADDEDSKPDSDPDLKPLSVPTACEFASNDSFGAPYGSVEEWFGDHLIEPWQYKKRRWFSSWAISRAFRQIKSLAKVARHEHSDLWLTEAARTSFISYNIEIPHYDAEGLGKIWRALQRVPELLAESNDFLVSGPMEFRFIKGGNSALAGTYTDDEDTYFANLDVIGFVKDTPVNQYPGAMLDFFAAIERCWYGELGGIPHNGKMYGFYDPTAPGDESTPPFNANFLKDLAKRRGDRLAAFEAYRKQRDPDGRFCNDFLRASSIGE